MEGLMTNKNMVKSSQGAQDGAKAGAGEQAMPEPNPTPPTPVPVPESDPQLFVTHDPMDSPQLKPNMKQDKTKGLKAE
jgi:hypothetical protein